MNTPQPPYGPPQPQPNHLAQHQRPLPHPAAGQPQWPQQPGTGPPAAQHGQRPWSAPSGARGHPQSGGKPPGGARTTVIAGITLLSALCLSVPSVPRLVGRTLTITRGSGTSTYDVAQYVLLIAWQVNGLLLLVLAGMLLARKRSALVPAVAVLVSTEATLLANGVIRAFTQGYWPYLLHPWLNIPESTAFYLCTAPPILALLPSTLRTLSPKPAKSPQRPPHGTPVGY